MARTNRVPRYSVGKVRGSIRGAKELELRSRYPGHGYSVIAWGGVASDTATARLEALTAAANALPDVLSALRELMHDSTHNEEWSDLTREQWDRMSARCQAAVSKAEFAVAMAEVREG